ncbi:MAG: serine hydrolase domain-containing protein [Acidobacteriota bacterium]|nr:serine hydrolase domain-containing protein [Acidobacteriota bacterium]
MRRVVLGLVCMFLVEGAGLAVEDSVEVSKPEAVGMSSERLGRIVPAMAKYVDAGKIPGVVSLVARKGQVVHFEAIGQQNVAKNEPMARDTLFRLYSQSKPVTGVAVMILYEEGHFLLTDPVAKYLPEFSEMKVYLGEEGSEIQTEPARPMTIQHLLTHTSGLTYDFFGSPVAKMYTKAGSVGAAPMSPHGSLEQWSKALAQQPLIAQPGTAWNYSVGMDVLGRLIEVTSGQSFGDFLKARIFDPLGMVDTAFDVPDSKASRFAANYAPTPTGGMIMADNPDTSPYRKPAKLEMGGSGLVGTAADYLRFAQMLANDGELDGVRILAPSTVDLMMSNHLHSEFPPDPLTSLFGGGSPLSTAGRAWGLGFGLTGFVAVEPALTGIPMSKGTFSWGGAATTHFWVDREQELVGIVLTQLIPDGTYPLRQLMQQLTYQAIVE